MWVEGWFARMMYLSLNKMHELALHGYWKLRSIRQRESHVERSRT
jgi:hypothetical protein